MSDCCPESELLEQPCQLVVEDDCTVVVSFEEGPPGPAGPAGPAGLAATIAVGTVDTVAYGNPATVSNVGTSSAAIFDFDIPTGPQGVPGPPGAGGALGYYGSFYSDQDQTVALNTPTAMTLNNTPEANGVSIVASSRITFANAGTYDLQFSAQLHHRGGGGPGETVDIWFALNGTPIADSATRLTVPNGRFLVAAWDFLTTLGAGDYLEVYWQADTTSIALEHSPTAGGIPAIPSLIVTAMQVMYTQVGPTGPQGPAGVGVPIGGTTGQALVKQSNTDYDTTWTTLTAATVGAAPATPTVGTGLATTGTINLDLAALNGTYQSIALSGNPTFTTSNRAAGRIVTVRLAAGASPRTLAFPGWVFVGSAAPTTLAANKVGVFTVTMFDTTDAGAVCAYAAQP